MKILVNGREQIVPDSTTLADLLAAQGAPAYVAAAVNGNFVPRARHAKTALRDGDDVEILGPVQGG